MRRQSDNISRRWQGCQLHMVLASKRLSLQIDSNRKTNSNRHMRLTALAAMAAMITCVTVQAQEKYKAYVTVDELPNSITYLPAPADTADAAFFNDWLVYTRGLAKRPTERGAQAKADAEYSSTYIAAYYSKAVGFTISPDSTPDIYRLVARTARVGGNATHKAKEHYMRRRPFMVMHQGTMTPDDEPGLSKNGSYPSGHTSMGWSVALVLAEVCTDAQDEILRLGYEYGQSRTIVGAHWQSDVDAGRVTGAAAVARLHANAEFQADMAAAKEEYAKITGKDNAQGPVMTSKKNAKKRR